MKYIIATTLGLITSFAISIAAQAAPVSWDFTSGVLRPLQSMWGSEVRVPYITATSTATSTLPFLSSTRLAATTVCVGTDCRTSWPLASSSPWTVGNAAFVTGQGTLGSVATGTLTETATGLELSATRGLLGGSAVLALTSGYDIPLAASTSQWTQAFNWGNHATAGYINSTAGDWTGTFRGEDDLFYLSRSSHEGTQLASTISDFATAVQARSLGTSTVPTIGQVAFFTGARTVGSTATGTLTETATGLSLSGAPSILGGSSVLTIDAGFALASTTLLTSASSFFASPSSLCTAITGSAALCDGSDDGGGGGVVYLASTTPWTVGNAAYVASNGAVGSVATGTLTETVTGLELSATRGLFGGSAILALTSGFTVPSTTLITSASSFIASPSSLCVAITGSAELCDGSDGGGGGGGGALSTTTDIVGDGPASVVSYVTTDVMFGGSASTSAEFLFDKDGAKLIIATSSNVATTTVANNNNSASVQFGVASTTGPALVRGIHFSFSSLTQAVTNFVGGITEWVIRVATTVFQGDVDITGQLTVATTTAYGATSSAALFIDGIMNEGTWVRENCTSPAAEATQVIADTLRACGRYSYLEDANGVIDFVTPTTGSTTYFRIRAGALGTVTAAGDGMGIGWASGIDFGDIQRNRVMFEFGIKQDALGNATSSIVVAGITDKLGVSTDFATEPAQGVYVVASSSANWLVACNPPTGGTTYIDTGIASSTFVTGNLNPFTYFLGEIPRTSVSNTAVQFIIKARTQANNVYNQVASCTMDLSASTQLVAPTVGIGKSTAGSASELHLSWLKFGYNQPMF